MGRDNRGRGGCCGCLTSCLVGSVGFLFLTALLCAGLSLWVTVNQPEAPSASFVPSQSLANNFESKIRNAARSTDRTGTFQLSVTEAEVASWLNLNVPAVNDAGLPLEDLQVRFADGLATVYAGWDVAGATTLASEFSLAFLVTPAGQLEIDLRRADVGGVVLPEGWLADLEAEMQRILEQELAKITPNYRVQRVEVAGGRLTISGTVGR
ncbi:MAG: hypothetical protein HC915_02830 [Anaerolineae bacterium]|nr:hypothetical protein [Anaerolineae bacterium]